MLYLLSLISYLLFFTFIAWQRFHLGLALFFLLLPTYLIRFSIGPLPTTLLEMMFWIVVVVWIIRFRSCNMYHVICIIQKNKLLFIGTLLFLLSATISIFTSSNLREALGEWKAFYVEPIVLFFILATITSQQFNNPTIKQSNNFVTAIIVGLTLSGLATAILAIYQHFTGWMVPDSFWANQNTFRVTAWYGFPNAVGLFLAPIWPLALYLILKNKKQETNKFQKINKKIKTWIFENWNLKIICILYLVSSLLAIYFAKSTGALVGLAAGLLFFLFFYNKKTRLIACLVGIVGIASLISLPANNPIKQELLFQDRSGQIRLGIWSETIDFLKDNPIWGAGLASYQEKIQPYHTTVDDEGIEIFHHPHNIFLTMWVNLGLIGLISFILIIIWFAKKSLSLITYQLSRNIEHGTWNRQPLFIASSMVIILIVGLVDSPYIKNDLAMLFWLLPAMLITQKNDGIIQK